ncbi:MAG: beta-1,6-N-acetylglucosaminyltransferase [Oscillospiraceae bacterium]|nr:beta-1,6-N-acetylglucosaminyltransferase [Oscillospiraceae bacterium]
MTHAYMILAHHEFPLLGRLVSALDYPCNDIYVHIDKKVDDELFERIKGELEGTVKQASIAFTPRVNVVWGDFSIIEAELLLLREASATHHDYYHLLSGVDLPIKPHSEILRFFEENAGKEFIQGVRFPPRGLTRWRIRYYFPLQKLVGHNFFGPLGLLQWLLLLPQMLVGVNRLRKLPGLSGQPSEFYKSSNWFSATHGFVTDLLEFYGREENIRHYRRSMCADEIFVQMYAFHSKYRERIFLHQRYPGSEGLFYNNMRRFVFQKGLKGSPVTYTMDDLARLTQSRQLWARKFSYDKHPEVVDAIMERIAP